MAETVVADLILRRSLNKQRVFLDRFNPLERLRDDAEVKARFRFRRDTIYSILVTLWPFLNRPTKRSCALPPLVVLCAALRFFPSGAFFMVIGDTYFVSPASVCRCVQQVSYGLIQIAPNYIKMPSNEALPVVKQRFYEIASK